MKKFISLLLVALMVITMAGCSKKEDKVEYTSYTVDNLTLQIPSSYQMTKEDDEEYKLYMYTDEFAVIAFNETFEELKTYGITDDELNLKDYSDLVIQLYGSNVIEDETKGNTRTITYAEEIEGQKFYYMTAYTELNQEFWSVTYFCLGEKQATYDPLFRTWLQKISFK